MIEGVRGVHHVALSTPDLEGLVAFYCGTLGFEELERFGWEKGQGSGDDVTGLRDSAAQVAMLRAGSFHLEIFQFSSPTPKQAESDRPVCDHGITHLALDVVGIDSLYEKLRAGGMRFHSPPCDAGDGVRVTYGRDPDGNVLELQELPKS